MDATAQHRSRRRPRRLWKLVLLCLPTLCGCAAFRDLDGIPAEYLPDAYRAAPRTGKQTIDLSLLRITPPAEYRVDAGDVLGIYIEGVLGTPEGTPPVYNPSRELDRPAVGYPILVREDGTIALPLAGPISVRGLSLREVEEKLRLHFTKLMPEPIVRPGRSRVLVSLQRPRTYKVLVVRQESGNRLGNVGISATVNWEVDKRGTGRIVELPAYQNDVLHALAQTGGLPGLDAQNAVYVIRGGRRNPVAPRRDDPNRAPARPSDDANPDAAMRGTAGTHAQASGHVWPRQAGVVNADAVRSSSAPLWPPEPEPPRGDAMDQRYLHAPPRMASTNHFVERFARGSTAWPGGAYPMRVPHGHAAERLPGPQGAPEWDVPYAMGEAERRGAVIRRIPLRMFPGEVPQFTEEDITLFDGDVVFIETRQTEFFYTGGLLGGGQFALPRDYDVDVLEAIAIAAQRSGGHQGSQRTLGGPSAMNHDVTVGASELIVFRRLPDGREVRIDVDLYEAMKNPDRRPLVAPGDYLVLRYTPVEACAAWFERLLFDGVVSGINNSQFVTGNNN